MNSAAADHYCWVNVGVDEVTFLKSTEVSYVR